MSNQWLMAQIYSMTQTMRNNGTYTQQINIHKHTTQTHARYDAGPV